MSSFCQKKKFENLSICSKVMLGYTLKSKESKYTNELYKLLWKTMFIIIIILKICGIDAKKYLCQRPLIHVSKVILKQQIYN